MRIDVCVRDIATANKKKSLRPLLNGHSSSSLCYFVYGMGRVLSVTLRAKLSGAV